MKLVFASHNAHKVEEIKAMMPAHIELLSLTDLGYHEEIPETAATIEGNAILKATFLRDELNCAVFADDTGLIVPALNGEPGVFSARYAGPQKDANDNMDLLLEKLTDKTDRSAYFQTVIALWINGEMHQFEGSVNGEIIQEKRGVDGFGSDPIFIPENKGRTFAEMNAQEKNALSHRGRALEKMLTFLNQ